MTPFWHTKGQLWCPEGPKMVPLSAMLVYFGPFSATFGPSGHHNWPFLCQKGVIVISPDDDHSVPTFVQLVLAILGSRALQMPFLAILEHFDPKSAKSAQKWPNWFRHVSSKWISPLCPHFYEKMSKK